MWIIVGGLIVNLLATFLLVVVAYRYAPSEAFQVDDEGKLEFSGELFKQYQRKLRKWIFYGLVGILFGTMIQAAGNALS